jgi:hypothetical protein
VRWAIVGKRDPSRSRARRYTAPFSGTKEHHELKVLPCGWMGEEACVFLAHSGHHISLGANRDMATPTFEPTNSRRPLVVIAQALALMVVMFGLIAFLATALVSVNGDRTYFKLALASSLTRSLLDVVVDALGSLTTR